MKKLITSVAIIGAAFMANAASVDWCYYDNSEDGVQVGYTIYAIAGAVQSDWASIEAVKAAAMKGIGVVQDQGRSYDTGDVTSASDSLTKESGYFLVVVNATEDKFAVVAGNSANIYDPQAQETSKGAFSVEDIQTTSSFSGGPGPIPEPTTGLLLILGVAGLALRRNRS